MMKLLIGVLAAALMIPAGWALAGSLSGDDAGDRAFTAGTTTTTRTTTTERDRPARKADRGRGNRGRRAGRREDRVREAGEDVRGPCDEAEHRNDPRCTGAGGHDDDRSGPGRSGPGRGGSDDD